MSLHFRSHFGAVLPLAGLLSWTAAVPAEAQAAGCKPLTIVASAPIFDLPDGRIAVTAEINGRPEEMMVDTNAYATTIDNAEASALGLTRQRAAFGNYFAAIHTLEIGNMRIEGVQALISRTPLDILGGAKAFIGTDLLQHYDIELDFKNNKLNLMSPDHCPGAVYWPATAIAAMPVRVDGYGLPSFPVTLDGVAIDARFHTGATDSFLTDKSALDLFGLTPESPGMTRLPDAQSHVGEAYRYVFKSLDLGGVTITNIPVTIYHNPNFRDFLFGMHEIRRLHFALSYGDRMLYATANDASAGAGK